MYINNAYEVLVLILATTLAVFLILAIIAAVKINQILSQVQRITEKAERFADKAESVGEFFSAATGPAAIGKLIANMTDAMKNRKGKNGE